MKLANSCGKAFRKLFLAVGLCSLATTGLPAAEPAPGPDAQAPDPEEEAKLEEFSNWMGGATDTSNWIDFSVAACLWTATRHNSSGAGRFRGMPREVWLIFIGRSLLGKTPF